MLVIDKTIWEDGDVNYNISIQDARYDHKCNTVWGRLKRAASALFGKPVYFNDIFLPGEHDYGQLLEEMKDLQDFRGAGGKTG